VVVAAVIVVVMIVVLVVVVAAGAVLADDVTEGAAVTICDCRLWGKSFYIIHKVI
jgi:hypothetical protein